MSVKVIFEDEDWVEYEFIQPNDLIGNTEWWSEEDWKKWKEKMEKLEEANIKGNLETFIIKLKKNPFLDGKIFTGDEPQSEPTTDNEKDLRIIAFIDGSKGDVRVVNFGEETSGFETQPE